MKSRLVGGSIAAFVVVALAGPGDAPAPISDRVGFPKDYAASFEVLRVVARKEESKLVTIFGNAPAARVTNVTQLPYPYGAVFVMETASVQKDSTGKALLDAAGNLHKDTVLGLHVMRREKDYGAAYETNRAGEWEFVEYRPDGTYITPPEKSAGCAACHVKAGHGKDFVYRGRLAGSSGQ